MKLYFGNAVTAVTTGMSLALVAFITDSVINRARIRHWGCRSLILLIFGLVVCCFAAARDGLDRTIQCAIDKSCTPGIFPLLSVPNIVGCIGAFAILVAAIAIPLAKTERMREIWFFVMSCGVLVKITVVEIARILLV